MNKYSAYRFAPPMPPNEAERQQALENAKILDTAREQDYDDLLRLACAICATPMGTISLVDKNRQWFKSRIGVDAQETPRDISFCGHAILGDGLFEVRNAARDERFRENPMVTGEPGLRFYAGIPLTSPEGFNIGMLCVMDTRPRELNAEQREMLAILAQKVTSLIHARKQTKMLESALRHSVQAEQDLLGSTKLFAEFMDNTPAVCILKDEDGRMIWYNRMCSERFGVDRKEWMGKLDSERFPADRAKMVRTYDQTVLDTGRVTETYEAEEDAKGATHYWNAYRFRFVDHNGKRFVASIALDVTRAATAEAEVAHAQEKLEAANARLAELAITDALTGLKNRRAFDERIQHEFALAVRHNFELSLLMIDVDHFKDFNDTHGHAMGDEALRSLAGAIQTCVRGTDLVARYGGEEFAVILPSTGSKDARLLAERIARAVEAMDSPLQKLTVSVGISSKTPEMVNRESFMAMADEALYKAKDSGRNCIVVAEA